MNNHKLYLVLALTAVMAANVYGQMLDTDGNTIFNGRYYVVPVISGRGGDLTLRSLVGELCPIGIVQESLESLDGLPVKFSNWKSNDAFVPLSVDLNIETDVIATICGQSYWRVGEFDERRQQYFIVAGPKPEGYEGDSLKSFFKIEAVGVGIHYKFVFCPNSYDGSNCGDVQIFKDEVGIWRLALSDEPFPVQFRKA